MPTTWNELSEKQLIQVAGLLNSQLSSPYEFRIKAVQILAKLNLMQVFALGELLVDLYPFVEFLEKEIELTSNRIESIKAKRQRFFGPIGNFETLTAGEWTEADEAYMDYSSNQNSDALNRLMAILYRDRQKGMWKGSSKWAGDYRIPYMEATVNTRIEAMQRVPIGTKLAVLLWWKGCRREWEQVFERVFKDKSEGPESFGWAETVLKLSGSEFGSEKETRTTPMYKLMLKMEVTLKDEEYRKEQEKAHQKSRS